VGKLLAVLLLAVPALATEAEDFAKDLEQLQKFGRGGRWKVVARKLPELLDEHKGQNYVRARRAAIVDLAKRSAFRAKHPPPDPKKVVQGKLLAWNPQTRKVKISYDRKQMGNWIKSGKALLHPAVFTGPHTITLDGKYPKGKSPQALVCVERKRAIYVIFGLNTKRWQLPARILLSEGGETVRRAELTSLCTDKSNFPVRIVVKNKAVVSTRGNRKMASMRKDADHWGRFAFFADPSIREVTLQGQVEPSWMQGLLDKAETKQRQKFEASYDVQEDLPEWLFETPDADTDTELAEPDRRPWPGNPGADEITLAAEAMQHYNAGEVDDGYALVSRAEGDEAVVQYLKAIFLDRMADHAEALTCARRVVQLDPEFTPARELEAKLLAHLRRPDEATKVYDALLQKYPGGADLHAQAAVLFLKMSRPNDAARGLQWAQAHDLSSRQLDHVQKLVNKATNGPAWPRSYEYESRHYHVVTDIDKKTCMAAAKYLEQAYVLYTVRLDRVKDAGRRRFKVYLFSGPEGYLKYTKDLFGRAPVGSAGVYITLLKQFLIWNLPEREQMMQTVRHEGFHQYLDRIMEDPPAWFNEGLAEYYEIAKVARGGWQLGDPYRYHLDVLAQEKNGIMPLKEFLYRDHSTFMKTATHHYAQSWAFIQFLRHTTRENKQLFGPFWNAFKTIPSRKPALDHALEEVNLRALESDFQAHVTKLQSAAKR
jgi:tetratricopeptide (TPR) repeat protein